MQPFHDFRVFYNQNIFPELVNLERRRRRLIRLLSISVLLLTGIGAIQIYLNIFLVTLMLFIPVGLWTSYLVHQIQVYYQEFKPRIVGLVLDFIDNDVNYRELRYQEKGKIPKEKFLASKIFTRADVYHGEDLITGWVRELPFEMCELNVLQVSSVRDQLEPVFRGIFVCGDFYRADMLGSVLILPDAYRKYLSHSERAFHRAGGRRVKKQLLDEFEAVFDTYATPQVRVAEVISTDLQRAILRFRERFLQTNQQKDIYLSIIEDNVYVALSHPKNLLEPSLFRNTVSFEVVQEFYDDIHLLLEILSELDVLN
ncbi:MAG: DUF3137 domain-containing protein [Saprospiraceae bacterium]|nr:DUF3137 domain-containing protein [Saprospiraceae bacterium]MDW8228852.1 DUF3137 domain-containing protein [Saprospiraceae bacterium]